MLFFNELNTDQKRSFLALATRMLLADGKVAPEEEWLLQTLSREVGGPKPIPAEEIYGPVNVAMFPDRRSRVIVTVAFLIMGLVDNHFHVNESTVFHHLVTEFGFSDAEIARMSAIAGREKAIMSDIEALIG